MDRVPYTSRVTEGTRLMVIANKMLLSFRIIIYFSLIEYHSFLSMHTVNVNNSCYIALHYNGHKHDA